jgi:hypothetical protein
MNRRYYVNINATGTEKGTFRLPFKSINNALVCSQDRHDTYEIIIAPGTYNENIKILSAVKLCGAIKTHHAVKIVGSIINTTAFPLSIMNLQISNSTSPGAIFIKNVDAITKINNVLIDNSTCFGIFLTGGKFVISESEIINTRGSINQITSEISQFDATSLGTAIYVSEAHGDLKKITLIGNFAGVIADVNSHVTINTLYADRHITNPELKNVSCNSPGHDSGFATIEARNGAEMQMVNVHIANGESYGISVHTGAILKAKNLKVSLTKEANCRPANKGLGGVNITVRRGGSILDLNNFEAAYADLIGIQIIEAYAHLINGKVHHNLIGSHVVNLKNSSINHVFDSVIFYDNGTKLSSDFLPIPDAVII